MSGRIADRIPVPQYKNLDIEIIKRDRGYEVTVRHYESGTGPSTTIFKGRPLAPKDLKKIVEGILAAAAPVRGAPEFDYSRHGKDIGTRLFAALFQGPTLTKYMHLRDTCKETEGVRLRLHLGRCPELIEMPWEFLYDSDSSSYLATRTLTPIVRRIDLNVLTVRPLVVSERLEILVVASCPKEGQFKDVGVTAELKALKTAAKELEASGRVHVTTLERATIDSLQDLLRKESYHVLHFIGHGEFTEQKGGHLIFERDKRLSDSISAERIAMALQEQRQLRLVVINACKGAQTSAKNAFSGVAQHLVQKGIPAVVAMQFPISVDAALQFSRSFYKALTEGLPVDSAIVEARQDIFVRGNNMLEWATPVLYLQSEQADLFDFQARSSLAPVRAIRGGGSPRSLPQQPHNDVEKAVVESDDIVDFAFSAIPGPAALPGVEDRLLDD